MHFQNYNYRKSANETLKEYALKLKNDKIISEFCRKVEAKNKLKEDIRIAKYELIEMLTQSDTNYDAVKAHAAMIQKMQSNLDSL